MVSHTCSVEFERETESSSAQCSEGVELYIGPEMKGREIAGDGVVGYTEDPVPGKFLWQLSIYGQPAKVHVVHSFGEQTIVDQSAIFSYTEHRPNGPNCEPACQNASVEWKLAADAGSS